MAAELDRSIARLRNARPQGIDATVDRMIELASAAPCETGLQAARKIARQASLLNRLGQPDRAVAAARKAGQLFADAGPLDGTDEGYFAYSLLPVAHAELADGDLDRAYSAGAYAAKLFVDHKDELIPAALRDLTWAMVVHADIAARQGATDRSRQSLFYAVDNAATTNASRRSWSARRAACGRRPWGLPVVPTAAEWEDLVAWMWDVAKRLGIA